MPYALVLRADADLAKKHNAKVGEVLTTCGHRHRLADQAARCTIDSTCEEDDKLLRANIKVELCPPHAGPIVRVR